jgi:hypothetical protein
LAWCAALLWSGPAARGFDQNHARYATVLETFVQDGLVDYAGLKAAPAELLAYLDAAADVKESQFEKWTRPQQLAFLINVYNAATLKLVADHYPVKSIKKIGGLFTSPWSLPVVRLWGQTNSLDWLEHEIIRARYSEARIHFALVCAARGCPPLRREPLLGPRIEEQLNDQGRIFLAQTAKNHFDAASGTLHLSPIFKWFHDDFAAEAGSVQAFVRRYWNPAEAAKLSQPKLRVRYTDYDWSLNARQAR